MEPEETGERLDFAFTAQLSTPLSLDPNEFKGQGRDAIAASIKKTLRDINSTVSYFTDEIDMAADLIAETNGA